MSNVSGEGTRLMQQIISMGEKHELDKLQALVESRSVTELKDLLVGRLGRRECITFWNYLLQGFDHNKFESREKRFVVVKSFLDGLLQIELSYKQTYDLVTRLCQDLPTFPSDQLIEIVEHCIEALRVGDRKCVGWKDLLPEALLELASQGQMNVNGVQMSGVEYQNSIVRNLCTMRWPTAVLTPIAGMMKELKLTAGEVVTVLNKFAKELQTLAPTELPTLAYQLFSMCASATQIIIPILALNKYFHHYYYKKLFEEMNSNTSDFDSIDKYSDKELCEAEETILHHLSYCTMYKISEIQLFLVMKNFTSMPEIMLTPFMISAVLSMTVANREPESRLNSSPVLSLLRSTIKHNEMESELADYSVWCRGCMQHRQVDLEQLITVLIDRNKEGKEIVTTGLVKLALALLRAKGNEKLNAIAYGFLIKFVRKRYVFGKGLIKKLCDWMIIESDQQQYSECLTLISIADTLTVSECIDTIKYVMDFFVWIPGEQAMHMMSFILPLLKISAIVRDVMCDALRRAMSSCELKTRLMAVYGFCMILKQLNNSNSQRTFFGGGSSSSSVCSVSNISSICTQHNISGYALMSQLTLGDRTNPQRHFNMLTLEIIGLLRTCFSQPLEIKKMLYENLQRAVQLNPKLVPHILQFIDWHFRSFFEAPPAAAEANSDVDGDGDDNDIVVVQQFAVKFDRLVCANDVHETEFMVNDNLGLLILFVSHCLVVFEKLGTADYDTSEIKRLLDMCIAKLRSKELELEKLSGQLTHYKLEVLAQQMNFIEGLMAYVLLTAQKTNDKVKHLMPLYRAHRRVEEHLKTLSTAPRKAKKVKGDSSHADTSGHNVTINGVLVKTRPQITQVSNIWDLTVLERMLRLLLEDVVPFAECEHTDNLRSSVEFINYVLRVTAQKIAHLRDEPAYKQLQHSRRMLQYLTDVTRVIYERCIKRLPELWRDFDVGTAALAADCFCECVLSANALYRKKFKDKYVKGFDYAHLNRSKEAPLVLQDHIDAYTVEVMVSGPNEELRSSREAPRIPLALLQTLEVLYDNIPYSNRITIESYTWLFQYCKTHTLPHAEMGVVHRLLFRQRQKTHSGSFYNTIAVLLQRVLGAVRDEVTDETAADDGAGGGADDTMRLPFILKSIDMDSAETCVKYLYETLGKQLDDVEFFILRAQNLNYKIGITPMEEQEQCISTLHSLERSICSQLVCISSALLQLSNVALPLGVCMDGLLRLLMQHYVCLKNLTKHFLLAASRDRLCTQNAKFDLLLHTMGKALPSNIYALISYIEGNILRSDDANDENDDASVDGRAHAHIKRRNPQAEKAKVLRETKLIPKIIMCVENFNKHVIMLSKKTNDRLANFLHFGTVRDFRIKTSALKAAIDRTFSHSSQIEVDLSAEQDQEDEEAILLARIEEESAGIDAALNGKKNGEAGNNYDGDGDDDDDEKKSVSRDDDGDDSTTTSSKSAASSIKPVTRAKRGKKVEPTKARNAAGKRPTRSRKELAEKQDIVVPMISLSSASSNASDELQHESNKETSSQLLKNLAAINKQTRKRTKRDAEQTDPDTKCVTPPPPIAKKRRGATTRAAK